MIIGRWGGIIYVPPQPTHGRAVMKKENLAIIKHGAQGVDVRDIFFNPQNQPVNTYIIDRYMAGDYSSISFNGFNSEAGDPNIGRALGIAADFIADVFNVDVSRVYFTEVEGFDCGLAYRFDIEDDTDEDGEPVPVLPTTFKTYDVAFEHPSENKQGAWLLFSIGASSR